MILNICYNDNCFSFPEKIKEYCSKNYPEIVIETYNENDYQERKKAFRIKGGYSARMTPFILLLTDDKEYIKAFYSEDKGCTLDAFNNFLSEYLNVNTRN